MQKLVLLVRDQTSVGFEQGWFWRKLSPIVVLLEKAEQENSIHQCLLHVQIVSGEVREARVGDLGEDFLFCQSGQKIAAYQVIMAKERFLCLQRF